MKIDPKMTKISGM